MGGAQSFLEGCFASDIIASIAPRCGTSFLDLFTQCKPKRPVPMMLTIGAIELRSQKQASADRNAALALQSLTVAAT
jgi:hypothetical protein